IAVATRVLSALLSVPAFFTPDAPGWAKLAAGAAITVTVVAVVLVQAGSRGRVGVA
ncbi:MAG: hypothetical protein HOV83_02895, partial [Catenulispora sp.]|nr:hypothetical protein [Catenulispora sp.]